MKQSLSSHGPDARRNHILQLLQQGECSVEALAARFAVSSMTIRRDLQILKDGGRIMRTHGGAMPTSRISFEFRYLQRAQVQRAAKTAIASKAVELIADGESVLLDSGTTTLAIAEQLRYRRNLTVVTASLPIASTLYGCEGISLLLMGGYLRHDEPDLTGVITETNLEMIRPDVAFTGADAIDEQGNLYQASPDLASILSRIDQPVGRIYVVADHTKMGRTSLIRMRNLREWSGLITNSGIAPEFARKLTQAGGQVIIVDDQSS